MHAICTFTGFLQFGISDSQGEYTSIICASLPGIQLTPLDWIVCCNPNSEIDGKHATYHKLTNSDKSLSTIMTRYSKSNIVGLIIINTTNGVSLVDELVNRRDMPLIPPVYIVSLDDGNALEEFFGLQEGVNVQIKVVLMNSEASLSMDHAGPRKMQSLYIYIYIINNETGSGTLHLCRCTYVCIYLQVQAKQNATHSL